VIASSSTCFFPPVAPLITMLMLGNLFKEVLVVDPASPRRANA